MHIFLFLSSYCKDVLLCLGNAISYLLPVKHNMSRSSKQDQANGIWGLTSHNTKNLISVNYIYTARETIWTCHRAQKWKLHIPVIPEILSPLHRRQVLSLLCGMNLVSTQDHFICLTLSPRRALDSTHEVVAGRTSENSSIPLKKRSTENATNHRLKIKKKKIVESAWKKKQHMLGKKISMATSHHFRGKTEFQHIHDCGA